MEVLTVPLLLGSALFVSYANVSCGSIFGIGVASGKADRGVIQQILASWVLTLPAAAVLAAATMALLS